MTEDKLGDEPGETLGDPAMPADPGGEPIDGVPPDIVEAVQHVANRYGVEGLDQLIETADAARGEARAALDEFAGPGMG